MSTHVEAILMSTHNIPVYGEISKIIPQLSQNTLLICSAGTFIDVSGRNCTIKQIDIAISSSYCFVCDLKSAKFC